MTVNTTTITSGPYTATGGQTIFDYTFRADVATDLDVYVNEILRTDYTVLDLGEDAGGQIEFNSGLTVNDEVYIRSSREATQDTEFSSQGGFYPEEHERAFDKLTYLIQQLGDKIKRTLRIADTKSELPILDLVAGKFVQVNATGDGFQMADRPVEEVLNDAVVNTVADLAFTVVVPGAVYNLKEYHAGTGKGGGQIIGVAGSTTYDNVNTFAGSGGYFERINTLIDSFHAGAKGDGVDDTAALTRHFNYCLTNNYPLILPKGTFVSSSLPTVNTSLTIKGEGRGVSTLKVKAGSLLTEFLFFNAPAGVLVLSDFTLDGNRANNGTTQVNGYVLYVSGLDVDARNMEITGSRFAGVFTGSGGGTSRVHKFTNCWIHSNGATVVGGNGVGIYGGGGTPTDHLVIENCLIEGNYCIDTLPGDSTAINAVVRKATIVDCVFRDNYNVNGGQVAITDGGSGGQDIWSIISDCIFDINGTFGGDKTGAVEINGCKVIVADVIVKNCNQSAIVIEGDSQDVTISSCILKASTVDGSCVNIITSGGTGGDAIKIDNCKMLEGFNGLSCQAGYTNVYATNNEIYPAVTNKVAGETNFKILRGNDGYAPASPDITAVGSPWTSTAQPWDCLVVLKTPNGISALTFGGASLSITAGTSFFVKAQRQFIATWSGSAPIFSFIQQQR